jgi:hypothetical protein
MNASTIHAGQTQFALTLLEAISVHVNPILLEIRSEVVWILTNVRLWKSHVETLQSARMHRLDTTASVLKAIEPNQMPRLHASKRM